MIIKVLVENTSGREDIGSEHGLSLYIETGDKKILFDTGASDLFLSNAEKMGVDISQVEHLILSHGHYDHGGGLEGFFHMNNRAKIYIHKDAFGGYFARRENGDMDYIGIKKEIKNQDQVILTEGMYEIAKGLELYTNKVHSAAKPASNKSLLMELEDRLIEDDFSHEQNLILQEDGKTVLITGCAHNGIINILKSFYKIKGHMPDYVLGGFHLSGIAKSNQEDASILDDISKFLLETKGTYYTGHCTGLESYSILKEKMGENIEYLSGGKIIEI